MKLWRKPFDFHEQATAPSKVVLNKDRCKGCEYCVVFCPTKALVMSTEMNAKGYLIPVELPDGKCLGCGLCEAICPDFALWIVPLEAAQKGE